MSNNHSKKQWFYHLQFTVESTTRIEYSTENTDHNNDSENYFYGTTEEFCKIINKQFCPIEIELVCYKCDPEDKKVFENLGIYVLENCKQEEKL